jgi:SPP1 gp7 family putative phage head morphogenesis protein
MAIPTQRLASPTGKDIVLRPVVANAGVEAAYRKRLKALIEEMHNSVAFWVAAQLRANTPVAQDAKSRFDPIIREGSPSAALRASMRRLSRRWQRKFDEGAEQLAKYFADKTVGTSDLQMKAILKRAGITVQFKMTAEARDAYQAVIGENVGLIRSIASQHLTNVEGIVMRGVVQGRDLAQISKALTSSYGVTTRRAALIARDQSNKATAAITKVRQQGLGITTAKWMHSSAGKEPRPSHVAANGKEYDVSKGMWIDGEWIFPGEMINCRCVSRAVIKGFIE